MSESQLDIICVYNNKQLFCQMVESTISADIKINIIGIDNTNKQFSSAASAYNYALRERCRSEVLIFCHQDIIWTTAALLSLYRLCCEDSHTLYGVAGVRNLAKNRKTLSAITDPHCKYTSLAIDQVEDVFTLDECAIAANKSVFSLVHFDSVTCNSWDFYAVEICLQCHLKHIRVAAVGVDIQHLSGGNIQEIYYITQRQVAKKYRFHFLKISTTCGWCYTWKLLDYYRIIATNVYKRIKQR